MVSVGKEYRHSVQCTVCKKNGFTSGAVIIQEADRAEDQMVDGETYECVKSFCYLGDTLEGADLAATA